MNIVLIYTKLRPTQTAVLKLNDDGTYTILVNSDKPIDVQSKGILHEIGHILNDDMYSHAHIDLIERMAHAREWQNGFILSFDTCAQRLLCSAKQSGEVLFYRRPP